MVATYIVNDWETCGLELRHTLLTVGFIVLDEKLKELDRLSLSIKPASGEYLVSPGALKVNKINLVEHYDQSETEDICREKLLRFLQKHTVVTVISTSPDSVPNIMGTTKINRLIPLGQNVAFDVVRSKLFAPFWEDYVSYRVVDTQIVARHYQQIGLLPPDLSLGLGSLADHYGVVHSQDHTAMGDCETTANVYRAEVKMGKDLYNRAREDALRSTI
jgi:Exonuclease